MAEDTPNPRPASQSEDDVLARYGQRCVGGLGEAVFPKTQDHEQRRACLPKPHVDLEQREVVLRQQVLDALARAEAAIPERIFKEDRALDRLARFTHPTSVTEVRWSQSARLIRVVR